MIDNYLNDDAKKYFSTIDTDENRDWVWRFIAILKKRFPKADHWVTGGVKFTYTDIRIGKKTPNFGSGSPVMYFRLSGSSPLFSIHEMIKQELENSNIEFEVARPGTQRTDEQINAWLDQYEQAILSVKQKHLEGHGYNPIAYKLPDDGNEEVIEEQLLVKELSPSNSIPPLNQILYGPPGTGKTYSTIDESLRILDFQFYEENIDNREVLKKHFDEFVTSGQIRFTTFHQSFSYEDFVEGLVATSSNGQIEYSVEPGIFKRLCEDAVGDQGSITIDSALDSFIEQVSEAPITLTTATGKKFSVSYRYPNTTLTCLPESSQTKIELPANLEHIRQVLSGNRPPKIYCESYVKGVAEHIKKENPNLGKNIIPPKNSIKKPYVLVIDEINRGNISKIFGELITLIEPSKRAGKAEELSVQLPYSKRQFSVPANVFIIGTMNTADRSLTSLDIALRRRFSFREMPPKPDELKDVVIQEINIALLLETINKRIEALLDRDHRIGHAYFMPLKQDGKANLNELKSIFGQQILPLLKEYFFEDWEKIGWILNDQNKSEDNHKFILRASNNLNELFGNKVASSLQNIDQRWVLNEEAVNDINSYRLILGANQ